MKLSVAAALLGQTVPTTLSKRFGPLMANGGARRLTSSKILEATSPQSMFDHDNSRTGLISNRRFMRQAARNLKNGPNFLKSMIPCDPKATYADIGILSCGNDQICEPSTISPLGGVCTPSEVNNPYQVKAIVQCDPSSIDIGILACEEGQFCHPNDASELGGFCVNAFTNGRRLNRKFLEDMLYNCEPWPPEDPFQMCDCSDVNMTTGTGTMFCSQNATASWYQGCDEYVVYDFFTYTFDDSVLVLRYDCYETKAPIVEKMCFFNYYDTAEPFCHAEWNGKRCTSCFDNVYMYTHDFDCSNVDGPVGDWISEVLTTLQRCTNSTCTNLCGEGSFMNDSKTDVFTFRGYNTTCASLAVLEENAGIFDIYCPYYIEAAQYGGCCELPNSTSAEGNSPSLPDSEPLGNSSTIPTEDDTSLLPEGETENGHNSAGPSTTIIASVAFQATAAMFLSFA